MEKTGQKQVKSVGEVAMGIMGEISGFIYQVRGREVMLDADLARIYGYETRAFNQQVRRNMKKFEGEDYMFQLTREELAMLARCQFSTARDYIENSVKSQIVTSRNTTMFTGQDGGTRKLPYAFTEQGVYMLMTVLKGELAVRQSRALVMAFKAMKDYILENRALTDQREQLKTLALVAENSKQLGQIDKKVELMDKRLIEVEAKAEEAVLRKEIAPVILDFNKFNRRDEFVVMNRELLEAKDFYQNIYSKAQKNIMVIDDYVDIRTLRLLGVVQKNIEVTIFSDNVRNYLHASDVADFRQEFPTIKIKFIKTMRLMHDRFIILDYGEKGMKVYHSGASSKDAGRGVTAIMEVLGEPAKKSIEMLIETLLKNPELKLR